MEKETLVNHPWMENAANVASHTTHDRMMGSRKMAKVIAMFSLYSMRSCCLFIALGLVGY